MRIYLKQPSCSWLDYTLRNITLYMKKSEVKYSGNSIGTSSSNPFDQLKSNLRNNIRRLKRDEKEEEGAGAATSSSLNGGSGPYKKVRMKRYVKLYDVCRYKT